MMGRLLLREAHLMVAAMIHFIVMRLAISDGSCRQQCESEKPFHEAGPFQELLVAWLVCHPGLRSAGHPSLSKRFGDDPASPLDRRSAAPSSTAFLRAAVVPDG